MEEQQIQKRGKASIRNKESYTSSKFKIFDIDPEYLLPYIENKSIIDEDNHANNVYANISNNNSEDTINSIDQSNCKNRNDIDHNNKELNSSSKQFIRKVLVLKYIQKERKKNVATTVIIKTGKPLSIWRVKQFLKKHGDIQVDLNINSKAYNTIKECSNSYQTLQEYLLLKQNMQLQSRVSMLENNISALRESSSVIQQQSEYEVLIKNKQNDFQIQFEKQLAEFQQSFQTLRKENSLLSEALKSEIQ